MSRIPIEQEVTIPQQTVTSNIYYPSSGVITSENDRKAAMEAIFNNRGSGAYSVIRLVRYSGYYCQYILTAINDNSYVCLEVMWPTTPATTATKLIYWLKNSDGLQKLWSI